jgi:hypothetical protein
MKIEWRKKGREKSENPISVLLFGTIACIRESNDMMKKKEIFVVSFE